MEDYEKNSSSPLREVLEQEKEKEWEEFKSKLKTSSFYASTDSKGFAKKTCLPELIGSDVRFESSNNSFAYSHSPLYNPLQQFNYYKLEKDGSRLFKLEFSSKNDFEKYKKIFINYPEGRSFYEFFDKEPLILKIVEEVPLWTIFGSNGVYFPQLFEKFKNATLDQLKVFVDESQPLDNYSEFFQKLSSSLDYKLNGAFFDYGFFFNNKVVANSVFRVFQDILFKNPNLPKNIQEAKNINKTIENPLKNLIEGILMLPEISDKDLVFSLAPWESVFGKIDLEKYDSKR